MIWLDVEILKDLLAEFGNNIVFDTPVKTKMTPHSAEVKIESLHIEDGVIIAKGNLNIEVSNPSPLCNSLIQRLKIIKLECKK